MNSLENKILTNKTLGKRVAEHWVAYLMILPTVIWYIVWNYFPMYGIVIAFKKYSVFKGVWGSEWVGLKNFTDFFSSPYAWRVIRNTLTINLYSLITIFPLTIILALLLNEIRSKKFKSGVQTMLYLPHFISTVVVAGIVVTFLSPSSGIVNIIIDALGGQKTYFLTKKEYFKPIYLIMGGWQGIGFETILYTAALSNIDDTLYEAAQLDGANKLRQVWHITLPGIAPTISLKLIMSIGGLLSVGSEAILLLYQPITYETADVISTYVYRMSIEGGNYSIGTAVGLFNGVVGALLIIISNKISKKVTNAGLW
ncbi:MAG: ABC transporter permease subunit [Firmicutes bacterium]|nr:ABC transporter permease subunit [Bacillota bacterium]